MKPLTAENRDPKQAHLLSLVMASALVLGLVACAARPLPPTPTAIPLGATATPRPAAAQKPSSSPTTGPDSGTVPELPPSTPTRVSTQATAPAGPESNVQSRIEELLVQRTVQDFLARLLRDQGQIAFDLYVTHAGRQGAGGELLDRFDNPAWNLAQAALLGIEAMPASPSGARQYEAQVSLAWQESGQSRPSTQTLTLTLTYETGLWLIDRIVPGEPTPSATSTARP